VEWEKTYGTEKSESIWPGPHSIQQTLDGGYIVAGSIGPCDSCNPEQAFLLKVDRDGTVEWSHPYPEACRAMAVHQNANETYVLAYGQCLPDGPIITGLMLTHSSGGKIWSKSLGQGMASAPHSILPTSDGGYMVAGIWGKQAVWTDSTGKVMSSRTYDFVECWSAGRTDDGGYIFAGWTGDVVLVKTDADGKQEWLKALSRPGESSSWYIQPAVCQTADGGYILASGFVGPLWLTKTGASGEELWSRRLGDDCMPFAVSQTCDSGYIVALLEWFPQAHHCVIKTNVEGDVMWTWHSQRASAYGAQAVRQTRDGGYIVLGDVEVAGDEGFDIYLAKLAPDSDCRPASGLFRRGDTDSDGTVQLTDAVVTLDHLFRSGPAPGCLDAADADDNGVLEITDAVFTLSHLFRSGPALPEPSAACGADPSEDTLGCEVFSGCQ